MVNEPDIVVHPTDGPFVTLCSPDLATLKKLNIDNDGNLTLDGVIISWTKSGSYTGDGTTSMAVTGIGFKPKYVKIWKRETVDGSAITAFETTDTIIDDHVDGGAYKILGAGTHSFETNKIISLDADGFTVDDDGVDNHPNKLNQVYNYLAIF